MRNPVENISFLQKQLNNLQLENQLLKNILDGAGISYYEKIKALNGGEITSEYDSNQGARQNMYMELRLRPNEEMGLRNTPPIVGLGPRSTTSLSTGSQM